MPAKEIVKKEISKKTGNTRITYSDGSTEIIPASTSLTEPKRTLAKGNAAKVDVYNQDFTNSLLKVLQDKKLNAEGVLPQYLYNNDGSLNQSEFTKAVEDTQGLRQGTKNVYGKYDWTSPEFNADFQKRQAWFLKDHPNFDPNDPKQVGEFQDAYNSRAKTYGLPNYFGANTKFKRDSLYGQNTYSAPSLNFDAPAAQQPQQTAPAAVDQTQAPDINAEQMQYANVPNIPPEFWLQDKIKSVGALNDMLRIKKYMPWQATFNPTLMDPTFYDPTRELAANSSLANTSSQAIATYAGPQAMNARLAQVQGNASKNAADILGRYNNLNVGVANQFEAQNAGTMNQYSADKANQATNLFDKTTIVNQQFDNSKNMARQNLRSSYIDAITNRGQTQALNSMNNQYYVDPSTGGYVNFYHGRPMQGSAPVNQSAQIAQQIKDLVNAGFSMEQAKDYLIKQGK